MDNTFDSLYYGRSDTLAGVDEVGVTSIAGPLIAACVVLPRLTSGDDLELFQIDDSKKIKRKYRPHFAEIVQDYALAYGIGVVPPVEIDVLNGTVASNLAMRRAIADCLSRFPQVKIDFILIDGNQPINIRVPHELIKQGDSKSLSIAAASILAKSYHSEHMNALHDMNPNYGFHENEGYKSKKHYEGLDTDGIWIGVHRTSLWPLRKKLREDRPWARRRSRWVHITENKLYRNEEVSKCAPSVS